MAVEKKATKKKKKKKSQVVLELQKTKQIESETHPIKASICVYKATNFFNP